MKYIIFTTSFLIFFIGCKPTETTKSVQYLDCYVRYLNQEVKIRAEATLKQGTDEKNAQPIEIKDGIKYNNATMSLIAKKGLTYKYERDGTSEPMRIFSFKNLNGKTTQFDLPVAEVSDFSFDKNIVTLKKPNTLSWVGTPLELGEKISLIWDNPENGTVTMQVSGTSSRNSIDFPSVEIDKLKPGKWTLYLVRSKVTRKEADGVVLRGVGESFSKTKDVLVKN
jgi:hypothetical protein